MSNQRIRSPAVPRKKTYRVPFSPTSSWNTKIPLNATYTSVAWPASTIYNYTVNHDDYAPPVYKSASTDPLVSIPTRADWGYPAQTRLVRMPVGATGAAGTDGEIIIIDGDIVYNFFVFDRTSDTTATCDTHGIASITKGTGWGTSSPFLGAGTTAVGASEFAGLLVEEETNLGEIEHAIQLVVYFDLLLPGFTGEAISGDGANASGILQEGQRMGIPPTTSMPVPFNTITSQTGLSPLAQKIFRAMKKYGAFVIDKGGATALRAQANGYINTRGGVNEKDYLWSEMGFILPLLQKVS